MTLMRYKFFSNGRNMFLKNPSKILTNIIARMNFVEIIHALLIYEIPWEIKY